MAKMKCYLGNPLKSGQASGTNGFLSMPILPYPFENCLA